MSLLLPLLFDRCRYRPACRYLYRFIVVEFLHGDLLSFIVICYRYVCRYISLWYLVCCYVYYYRLQYIINIAFFIVYGLRLSFFFRLSLRLSLHLYFICYRYHLSFVVHRYQYRFRYRLWLRLSFHICIGDRYHLSLPWSG